MSDHIRFQETGLGFIPLLKGTDGDLLLEQGSGTRRRKTTLTVCSRPTQKAIGGRGTHREELAAASIGQMEMVLPLQGLNEGRQKWHEPFATDLIGRLPGENQGALNLWSERSLSPTPRRWLHLLWMVEPPLSGSAGIACCLMARSTLGK